MVFTIRAIIEVLGFPEEHVREVTEKVIENLKKEEGINIIKEQINKTEKVKEKFFSCFVEVEMKIHDFNKLIGFCYNYMPSSLEILDAEKLTIPVRELTFGLNEMLDKFHQYNILTTNLTNKLKQLEKQKPQ